MALLIVLKKTHYFIENIDKILNKIKLYLKPYISKTLMNMKKLFTTTALAILAISAFAAWEKKGDPIYLIGPATTAGWNLDNKIEMVYSNGEYTLETTLTAEEFKFVTDNSWDNCWTAPAENTNITQVSETFGINYKDSKDYKYNVSDAGTFVLRLYWVDDYTAKLQVTRKYIYLVGDATTAGWTTGGIPIMYNQSTKEFVWEGTLSVGEFRFLTVDSWEKCLTAPGETTEISTAHETFGLWWNASDDSKNYNFKVVEKGSYTLRIFWEDVATSKIEITRREIYLIGSATSSGWTQANAQKMTFNDDGCYELNNVALDFGLFKFISQKDAWWPGYTAPENCEIIANGQDFNVLTYNDETKDNKFLAYKGTYNMKIYWGSESSWMLETNATRDAWDIDKTSLKIVGGATPNGWSATDMEKVSDGVFRFAGKLNTDSDGEFKFIWDGAWWPALLAPSADYPIENIGESTNLFYAQKELTNQDDLKDVDKKFKVTSAGGWAITVNLNTLTVSAEQLYIINGNKAYATLEAAISDANDGDVITVGADITETNTINKYIKIDAQGHSIGSITVTSAGKLELTSDATLETLVLQSQPNTGAGQLICSSGINATASECYLERQFYSGSYQQIWYSFGVPFTVDAANGVYTAAGNIYSNKNYYINSYSGENRARYGITTRGQTGYAWLTPTTLTAGEGYMIYIADKTTNTLRFKASNVSEVFNTDNYKTVDYTYYTGSIGTTHDGWNFITQPCTQNTSVEASAGTFEYIQVLHDGASSTQGSYTTEPVTAETIIAPFTAFFYQANADGSLTFTKSANAATIKSADVVENKYFEVTLTSSDGISDKTYVSASEDASENEYEIGKDLTKCGWSSAAVQICTYDFGQILTVNQAKAYDKTADLALVMSTPQAGDYSIRVTDLSAKGDIYLTKGGSILADLTDGETYNFASASGINKEYGIRIVLPNDFETDATETNASDNIYTRGKTIYINGTKAIEVVNLLGQPVSNPVQTAGIYVVMTNGKAVKLNIE